MDIVFIVLGVFKNRKYAPTDNKHKFAILISARNEEKVIKNLVQSIDKQDYPKDKLSVFVIAHNCTDNTADSTFSSIASLPVRVLYS